MDTLYHYCPSSTFASIIKQNSIRLSSLSLSNDYMEGKLITQTFERLLAQSNINAEEMEAIRNALKATEELFDGLGFCLSSKPDLLSQWRGYADDGQGFSIGFSKPFLEAFSKGTEGNRSGFYLYQVIYKPEEQEQALRPVYGEIKELIDSGKLKMPKFGLLTPINEADKEKKREEYRAATKLLWEKVLWTFPKVYTLKNEAFQEEAEWRLISYFAKDVDDTAEYRAVGNRLIPYREYQLVDLNQTKITEVYIGPKNITPSHVVEKFLKQFGHPEVAVHRSSATYR